MGYILAFLTLIVYLGLCFLSDYVLEYKPTGEDIKRLESQREELNRLMDQAKDQVKKAKRLQNQLKETLKETIKYDRA